VAGITLVVYDSLILFHQEVGKNHKKIGPKFDPPLLQLEYIYKYKYPAMTNDLVTDACYFPGDSGL
jgi:hypothetical protein